MKQIIRKAYYDYEKEEAWLNGMAAKGLLLTDYSWCRYAFEEGTPGAYIYRIELLEHAPTHAESRNYLEFLEESGIDIVAYYMRWVYLRKKAADGPFDLFSDAASRMRHYRRVNFLFSGAAIVEFLIALMELSIWLTALRTGNAHLGFAPLGAACLLAALGVLLLSIGRPMRKKLRKLKQERSIFE
ncbi:MAG: DUF2812 domain-containing protein [Christensenellaceae bacterium]|jgi:hypothetical protein|nr:DUF2812 domain-containing protein [Christensenellaceae bacterium]